VRRERVVRFSIRLGIKQVFQFLPCKIIELMVANHIIDGVLQLVKSILYSLEIGLSLLVQDAVLIK
jgi:hypothetical protein